MSEPVAVVFAGGQGTRLWPLSRDRRPKQFQAITGDAPLLSVTIDRLKELVPAERIYISTAWQFREAALECRSGVPEQNLILEQEGKGPSTAFALAHAHVHRAHGNQPVLSCPSDHMVDDEPALIAAFTQMLRLAEESPEVPVLLAAEPTRPDTGLGYFRTEVQPGSDMLRATSMVEKPTVEQATELIETGTSYWNTASYVVHPESVLSSYRARRPYVMSSIDRYVRSPGSKGYGGPASTGHELAPLFDAGLRPSIVVSDFGWNDVGTWPRIEDLLRSQLVDSIGSSVSVDSQDVLTVSLDGRPVVALGVEGLLVVSHDDAVYVIDKRRVGERAELDRWRSSLAGSAREDLL